MARNCSSNVTHSLVKVEENKRKAIFRNKARDTYTVSVIDGCLITEGSRADFLVQDASGNSVIVELKGKDVDHACEQLSQTIKNKAVSDLITGKFGLLVVSSRYPKFDTYVRRAKSYYAREHKAGFHVVCDSREFDISRVVEIDGPY